MKLTAFFILAACLHVNATGYGQKVTLSEREVHIEKIFTEIKKQTGYNFLYTSSVLNNTHRVTVKVTDATVNEVLDICLQGQGLEYRVKLEDNLIIIKTKPQIKTVTSIGPAQGGPIDVSGKVTDGEGRPLPGANVKVRGSNIGVTTDNNGNFYLKNVPENSVLEISFVGHEMKTFTVRGTGFMTIALDQKLSMLDETVVIAYGQTTRRFATGNIASVKAADIEKQPVTNPLLALQGRVPGLFITQESGVVGGPVTVRIQGQNSITKGNDPLIVIDGIPYYSNMPRTGNEGALYASSSIGTDPSPLAFINASDIESIDVLKDADATSIYGARAANGAILITTKKGKTGAPRVNINLRHGWSKVTRSIDMLNARQYLDMRYEAIRNDGLLITSATNNDLRLWDTTQNTDWQKTLIGNIAQSSNINASVMGGVNSLQYLLSCTYNRNTTVFPGDFANENGTVHFNFSNESGSQRLKFQLSTSYMTNKNRIPASDLTQKAITLEPVAPNLYNDDGSLNWALNASGTSTWENPIVPIVFNKNEIKSTNLLSNVVIGYKILKSLEIKANAGYNRLQTNDYYARPIGAIAPENRNIIPSRRGASYGNRLMDALIIEPQILYKENLGKGKLEALAGFTFNQETQEYTTLNGSGYSNDESLRFSKAANSLSVSGGYSLYKYVAVFGRVNYNLKNRYIINANMRRDGSSRFGDKNKFHNFLSIGGAWIFSEETFFNKERDWLSFGKLRASFGTTGSDQIGNYSYLSLYSSTFATTPYQNSGGLLPNGLNNPYLEWEETRKLQFGIDVGLLNEKVLLGITYARNRSSNQLLNYPLPWITGFSSITDNFPATVQNTSWEFVLNLNIIRRKGLIWSNSINLTIPQNKLINFPNIESTGFASGTGGVIIGEPIGIKKVYSFAGVDPNTGKYQFIDAGGNVTSTPSSLTDRIKLIRLAPKFYGGYKSNFEFRDFQLDIFIQFVKQVGNPIFFNNGVATAYSPGIFSSSNSNQPVTVLSRWQKTGDETNVQRFSSTSSASLPTLSRALLSDANFTDASFIRIKNVAFSYKLPVQLQKKLRLQNARLYIQCQNLFTITKYEGLDPENQSIYALPPLRDITVGLQLTL